ncbi:MAG: sensor histidine kinase [Pirellulaceae bacterium]
MNDARLHVLLVEDNPYDADLLVEGLAGADGCFDVVHVECLEEAEAYLKQHATVDVVLLDLGLPGSGGLATLERARCAAPHLPMIVLTGLEDEATAIESLRKGAQDYLIKGEVRPLLLVRAIHHSVERKRMAQELCEARDRLASLARFPEEDPAPVLRLSTECTLLYANRAADLLCALWQLQPGQPVAPELAGPARRALAEGSTVQDVVACGDRIFSVTFSPTGFDINVYALEITDRKRAEEELAESEKRFRALVTASSEVMYRMSADWSVMHEPNGRHFIGATETSNTTWLAQYIPPEDQGQVMEVINEAIRTKSVFELEHRVLRADNSAGWTFSRAIPLLDANGEIVEWFGSANDITHRKRAEEALKKSLAEKEVLLKEIHHRVKNNMQVISSLVALQAERTPEADRRASLQDVAHRVRSMALVHEKLYQSTDLARVEFAEYARSLLNYLWRAHTTTAAGIELILNLEPMAISVNAAVPCGLILNELVSNALKHAFCDRADGQVTVSLCGDKAGRLCLRVRDNGRGLPTGFDWRQADSLGLHLVQVLARQLHATVEVVSTEGTEFTVTIGQATS